MHWSKNTSSLYFVRSWNPRTLRSTSSSERSGHESRLEALCAARKQMTARNPATRAAGSAWPRSARCAAVLFCEPDAIFRPVPLVLSDRTL